MRLGHHGFSEISHHKKEVSEIGHRSLEKSPLLESIDSLKRLEAIKLSEQISASEIEKLSLTEQRRLLSYINELGKYTASLQDAVQEKLFFLEKHKIETPSDLSKPIYTEIKNYVPEIKVEDLDITLPKDACSAENVSRLFNYLKLKKSLLSAEAYNLNLILFEKYYKPLHREIGFREIKEAQIAHARKTQDALIDAMQHPSGKSAKESADVFIKHFNSVEQEAKSRIVNKQQILQARRTQDALIEAMQHPSGKSAKESAEVMIKNIEIQEEASKRIASKQQIVSARKVQDTLIDAMQHPSGKSAKESAEVFIKHFDSVEQEAKNIPKETVEVHTKNKGLIKKILETAKNHKGLLALGALLAVGVFALIKIKKPFAVKNKNQALLNKPNASVSSLNISLDEFKKSTIKQ